MAQKRPRRAVARLRVQTYFRILRRLYRQSRALPDPNRRPSGIDWGRGARNRGESPSGAVIRAPPRNFPPAALEVLRLSALALERRTL